MPKDRLVLGALRMRLTEILGRAALAQPTGKGFRDLVARITLDEVGLILSMDVTRLARNA